MTEAAEGGKPLNWGDRPCLGTDLELWFGPADDVSAHLQEEPDQRLFRERAAKAVCADCLFVEQCLADELQRGITEQWGVRGGMAAGERQALIRQRRAAEKQVA
jgi:hypothetical protein